MNNNNKELTDITRSLDIGIEKIQRNKESLSGEPALFENEDCRVSELQMKNNFQSFSKNITDFFFN